MDPTLSQAGIDQLDLTMVKRKLMEPFPEGRGWSADQAETAEKWYKRYLALCAIYPAEAVVPNYPIDAIWHQHILDTASYAADCDRIFGHFLHHFPYFGLRGEDDRKHRDGKFDLTNELYLRHFGEDCRSMAGFDELEGASCKGGGSGGGGGCSRNIHKLDAYGSFGAGCKGGGSGGGGGCSRNVGLV